MLERNQLISMVLGLQAGDPNAATTLYETFQGDIYYFILKTVNNDRELAEDLTQDTFVEILETINNLQEPAAFVTWSKQIAYHKCTGYFRKRKELLADENEDGYSVFDTIEEDREEFIPDAALDHQDLRQTIINMINALPEEQKSAILLRYFNEISVKEIAQIQGVTEGTVKSRLNYGRKSIKQAVEAFEKKNDVKLHSVAILPLLLWFFKKYRIDNNLHITSNTTVQAFVIGEESAGAAIAGVSTSTSASAAAGITATTSVAIKTGITLAPKVIACALIATVAGGSIWAAITSSGQEDDIMQPTIVMMEQADSTNSSDSDSNIIDDAASETQETPEATDADDATTSVTETPTNDVCNHVWIDYGYENHGLRECSVCGRTEAIHSETGSCNHEKETTRYVYVDVIEEEIYCGICNHLEQVSYPNTCSHQWEESERYSGETIYIDKKCNVCGAFDQTIEMIDPTQSPKQDPTEEENIPTDEAETEASPEEAEHQHAEVVVGAYTYVYCSYVVSPYKSEDGYTVYYPYEFYF